MYINSKQINCSSNIEDKSKLEESLKLYVKKKKRITNKRFR